MQRFYPIGTPGEPWTDANGDGRPDLSDAVYLLLYLFARDVEPACLDAGDADDDGAITIGDPIHVLTYLYAGGAVPPPPFPEPGSDATPDDLTCGEVPFCDGVSPPAEGRAAP